MKEKLKKILLIGVVLFMTLGAIVIVADGDLDFKKVEMNSLFSSGGRTTVFINECKECAPSTTELGKFPFTNKLNVKNDKTNTLEEIDSQVTQVGFNLIYGHNKNLIIYLGEIPVELATASEDELTDVAQLKDLRYSGLKESDGVTWSSGVHGLIEDPSSAKDGNIYEELRKIANSEDDVRLLMHLYAQKPGIFAGLANTITRWFVSIALTIIHYIFLAKRLDIDTIISVIKIKELGDVVNQLFIGNNGAISPFLVLCIIGFIMCMVGAAYHYVKGNGAIERARETFILALVAILIIGAALTNRAYTLSSPAANLIAELVEGITVSTRPDINIFLTKSNNKKSVTAVTSLNQEAMIQKIYIDMTIESQFGTSIDNLKLDGSTALSSSCSLNSFKPDGTKSAATKTVFGNNLGYYFWYANSGITNMTNKPADIDTFSGNINKKMEDVLNCLQSSLDASKGDTTKRHRIIEMTKSLAGLGGGTMNGANFLFAIECILLSIILARFVIPTVLAKFELLISTLGLAVAGPLFLINNKKTIKFAKSILYMFLFAMLKITVYEIIVILVIYVSTYIMGTSTTQTLLSIFVMILGVRFAPFLSAKIKSFLDNAENSVAPELHRARASARQSISRSADEVSKSRFAGKVGEDGKVRMNLLGRVMGGVADNLSADGYKNRYRNTKQRKEGIKRSIDSVASNMHNRMRNISNIYKDIKKDRDEDIGNFLHEKYGIKETGADALKALSEMARTGFDGIDLDRLDSTQRNAVVNMRKHKQDYDKNLEQFTKTNQSYQNNLRLYEQYKNVDPERAKTYLNEANNQKVVLDKIKEDLTKKAELYDTYGKKLATSMYNEGWNNTKIKYDKKIEDANVLKEKVEEDIAWGKNGYNKSKYEKEYRENSRTLNTAAEECGTEAITEYADSSGKRISEAQYNNLSKEEQDNYKEVAKQRIKSTPDFKYETLSAELKKDLAARQFGVNDTNTSNIKEDLKNTTNENVQFEEDSNDLSDTQRPEKVITEHSGEKKIKDEGKADSSTKKTSTETETKEAEVVEDKSKEGENTKDGNGVNENTTEETVKRENSVEENKDATTDSNKNENLKKEDSKVIFEETEEPENQNKKEDIIKEELVENEPVKEEIIKEEPVKKEVKVEDAKVEEVKKKEERKSETGKGLEEQSTSNKKEQQGSTGTKKSTRDVEQKSSMLHEELMKDTPEKYEGILDKEEKTYSNVIFEDDNGEDGE